MSIFDEATEQAALQDAWARIRSFGGAWAHARWAVDHGLRVIRLAPRSKAPTERGWIELASADPNQLLTWARGNRDANLGYVLDGSGIVVIDIDQPEVFERWRADQGLTMPETAEVTTAKGRHRYHLAPAGGVPFKQPWGEVKATGQVVGIGSVHPDGHVYTLQTDAPIAPLPIGWVNALRLAEPATEAKPDEGRTFRADTGLGLAADEAEKLGVPIRSKRTRGTFVCPLPGHKHGADGKPDRSWERLDSGRYLIGDCFVFPEHDFRALLAHLRPEPESPTTAPAQIEFRPVPLSEVSDAPPDPLLIGRLDPHESTILFGMGDTGKGTLAASWIARLQREHEYRVLILDYENHDTEWSRRLSGLRADRSEVAHIAPLRAGLGALPNHADKVARFMDQEGFDYVVIDSAAIAVAGMDPSLPGTATVFDKALQQVGHPSLTLAHVTQAGRMTTPFGTVFWHNLTRVSWSLERKTDGLLLVNRKANNYPTQPAQIVQVEWIDGVLREVTETRANLKLEERIYELLRDALPRTVREIAVALNEDQDPDERPLGDDTIRRTLNRQLQRDPTGSRFTKADADRWVVRDRDQPSDG